MKTLGRDYFLGREYRKMVYQLQGKLTDMIRTYIDESEDKALIFKTIDERGLPFNSDCVRMICRDKRSETPDYYAVFSNGKTKCIWALDIDLLAKICDYIAAQ